MISADSYGTGISATVTPVYVEDNGTTTSLTIKAAEATKNHRIYGIVVSTDTAGDYVLKSGSETLMRFFLDANSGFGENFPPFSLATGVVNEALTLTKPSGANTAVTAYVATV